MALTILGAVLSILASLLPLFLTHMTLKDKRRDDLTYHSLDELHIGTERVRSQTPPV
jgi:hypothetical protein